MKLEEVIVVWEPNFGPVIAVCTTMEAAEKIFRSERPDATEEQMLNNMDFWPVNTKMG